MAKNCPKCGGTEFDAAGRCVNCGYEAPKKTKPKK